jgi:hypothetical protein
VYWLYKQLIEQIHFHSNFWYRNFCFVYVTIFWNKKPYVQSFVWTCCIILHGRIQFHFYKCLSTYTSATCNEELLIIHSEWLLVFWIFICCRVISQHINGWSCITILLCSSQDTHEEKGLVYKTVTKLNYWRQSCILVWTQRLILLPIVAELTNPCFWIFVCWYTSMWTGCSNQTERCSWGEQN